jgi:hypothetical protein
MDNDFNVGDYYIITAVIDDGTTVERTAKCTDIGTDGLHYGVYSPSNYVTPKDNTCSSIENFYVRNANAGEIQAWDEWYNQ